MTDLCDRFKVYLVDNYDDRAGEIDDFVSVKAKQVWNDVGVWTMDISRQSKNLVPLTTPLYGIDIWDTELNIPFCRGLIDVTQQKYDATTDTLTLTGWDDAQWLNWRLAHPSPAEADPPYTAQSYDVRTGTASEVMCQYFDINAGFTALPTRSLTLTGADRGGTVGSTITGRARWQVMLPFMQDLALQSTPTIGFRVSRLFGTDLQFQTYLPADRSEDVKFSVSMGNLLGGTIKRTSPKGTYVFAAGTGDLTARVYHESYDPVTINTWGRREYFHDVNNLSSDAELAAAGQRALIEQGETAEFSLQITDTANLTYGIDYAMGDKVTGVFVGNEPVPIISDAGVVVESIREIELVINADGCVITPTIGTPDRKDVFRIFREIRDLRSQITNRVYN